MDGNELWSRRLSGDALIFAGFANSIALVEGDVFVAGEVAGVQEKAFAVRLTAEGVELWKTVVADSLDAGFGIGVHESRVYLQADDIFVLDSMGEVVERLATGPAGKLAVNEDGIFAGEPSSRDSISTLTNFVGRYVTGLRPSRILWYVATFSQGRAPDPCKICVDGLLRATRLFGGTPAVATTPAPTWLSSTAASCSAASRAY